ncbi:hypothetical protein [Actinomyces capricornis]|uniref:Uncharacterized protein n=1 Tax=Actinomyces capricornis TaxID=2755559 RepID=A0ABN6K7U0_9ACTO|nr:hypothetical protein [Actinomyces capricornis]BDA65719.1 hypothetical protein MANAM107_25530 [Actinomyces capricornis]
MSDDAHDSADQSRPALVEQVLSELLAARKRPTGLSPTGMTAMPTVVALLGGGDPSVAFTQLQDRVLQVIDQDDDVLPIQAAAYSLGFASARSTHLARLNDFGADYGFEARQARRHSDTGLQRIAHLICTTWTVQLTPACHVWLAGQPNGALELQISTAWPWFIDMKPMGLDTLDSDSRWIPWQSALRFTAPLDPTAAPETLWLRCHLEQPLHLRPVLPVRLRWPGEVWPQFTTTTADLPPGVSLSITTLGNTWILSSSASGLVSLEEGDELHP